MHKLYDLKEKLIEELEDFADMDKFSKDDVESIKYMSSAVDHLCNIIDEYDGSYGMYDGSYARGRRGNVRRDTMGRYSREGYSRAMDDMTNEIHRLMKDAPNDQVRRELQMLSDKLEKM